MSNDFSHLPPPQPMSWPLAGRIAELVTHPGAGSVFVSLELDRVIARSSLRGSEVVATIAGPLFDIEAAAVLLAAELDRQLACLDARPS